MRVHRSFIDPDPVICSGLAPLPNEIGAVLFTLTKRAGGAGGIARGDVVVSVEPPVDALVARKVGFRVCKHVGLREASSEGD
jgi:hypothetical protein